MTIGHLQTCSQLLYTLELLGGVSDLIWNLQASYLVVTQGLDFSIVPTAIQWHSERDTKRITLKHLYYPSVDLDDRIHALFLCYRELYHSIPYSLA